MPPPRRLGRPTLTRADLPAEITADSLRHIGLRTLAQLARPGNGVLNAEEQEQFDAAFGELARETAARVGAAAQRFQREGPANLDPDLRRSYNRAQRRLAAQALRAQESLAEVTDEPSAPDPAPEESTDEPDDDASAGSLEADVEETSETLHLLERIADLQQHQLEHQESQLLSETRGYFFAFLVSVTVIVAGVAPLVEAEPHDRLLIVIWTLVAVAVAGIAYAVVRAVQTRR